MRESRHVLERVFKAISEIRLATNSVSQRANYSTIRQSNCSSDWPQLQVDQSEKDRHLPAYIWYWCKDIILYGGENMSPWIGSEVNVNYARIASCELERGFEIMTFESQKHLSPPTRVASVSTIPPSFRHFPSLGLVMILNTVYTDFKPIRTG